MQPEAVVWRLFDALNRHDARGMAECFAPDYRSEQPAHPARGFGGRDQVAANWATYFREVPDLRGEVLASATAGDTVWLEARFRGRRRDGSAFDLRGVIVNGVRGERIAWARLYLDEVERGGEGIGDAVERAATGAPRDRL